MPYIFEWNSNDVYLRLTIAHYKNFKENIAINKKPNDVKRIVSGFGL